MKKIFQLTSLLAMALVLFSCTKKELSTDQYDSAVVALKAYGPQPVVRGGVLRFVGSNLDKVVSVTIPGVDPLTPEVVTAGVHSEIRVTVPKDGPDVGYPVLTLADGSTLTGKTLLTYSEPIILEGFSPLSVYPGDKITITGDYLNLIHEVIYEGDVIVGEEDFTEHTRYKIVVGVPAEARTGKIALGTVDQTQIDETTDEGAALLATLNLIESEDELTVGTATGTFPEEAIKGGSVVTITGSHLMLTEEIEMGNYTVSEFDGDNSKISFLLSELAPDGEVVLVMASGVRVPVGTLTTVTPSELAVNPNPVKAGETLKVTGKDLDLVDNIAVGGVGLSDYNCNEDGTEISFPVPETSVDGDIILIMVNRKQVTVPFSLVKPVVTAFSANPAAAGSDLTITGTDLDLVVSVTFPGADPVTVSPSETEIVVGVPTAAESGTLVLTLGNGTTVEVETELAIDKPAGAYIANMPGDLYSPGDMFIIDIENADHLTGVQFDGEDAVYILNGSTLYVQIPVSAGANTTITLVSDNGSVTYAMNIDPGDFIVTPIWTGSFALGEWGGLQDLAWGKYDWSQVKAGQILRIEAESALAEGQWWCFTLKSGTKWDNLAGGPGQIDNPENPCDIVLTQEMIDDLNANNGLVIQGYMAIIKRVCIVDDLRYGTTIWEGSQALGEWGGLQDLAWGKYDWSQVKAGQTLFIFSTPNVEDGQWYCYTLKSGTKWDNLAGAPGQIDNPESPLGIKLNQEMVDDLNANNGLVIQGYMATITKITIK